MRSGQTLLFDADDTLWANNIFFERVIRDYLDWLAHPTLEHRQIRAVLDDVERARAHSHGFGSGAFLSNLRECFSILNGRHVDPVESAEIDALATDLLEHRIDLYDDVRETLEDLAARHDLKLVTKGNTDEQQRKVDASGLAELFSSIHIVPVKDEPTYRGLIVAQDLDTTSSWMIGNSPASDILPARAAGLRAVYLPNPDTWVLEHADLDTTDPGVLTLQRFSDLSSTF